MHRTYVKIQVRVHIGVEVMSSPSRKNCVGQTSMLLCSSVNAVQQCSGHLSLLVLLLQPCWRQLVQLQQPGTQTQRQGNCAAAGASGYHADMSQSHTASSLSLAQRTLSCRLQVFPSACSSWRSSCMTVQMQAAHLDVLPYCLHAADARHKRLPCDLSDGCHRHLLGRDVPHCCLSCRHKHADVLRHLQCVSTAPAFRQDWTSGPATTIQRWFQSTGMTAKALMLSSRVTPARR